MRRYVLRREDTFAATGGKPAKTLKAVKAFETLSGGLEYWLTWVNPAAWQLHLVDIGPKAGADQRPGFVEYEDELFDVASADRTRKAQVTRSRNLALDSAHFYSYEKASAYFPEDLYRSDRGEPETRRRQLARLFEDGRRTKHGFMPRDYQEWLSADMSFEEIEQAAWDRWKALEAEVLEKYPDPEPYEPKAINTLASLDYSTISHMEYA